MTPYLPNIVSRTPSNPNSKGERHEVALHEPELDPLGRQSFNSEINLNSNPAPSPVTPVERGDRIHSDAPPLAGGRLARSNDPIWEPNR